MEKIGKGPAAVAAGFVCAPKFGDREQVTFACDFDHRLI
jgi:hypothetical protein